jgi:type II secretory ATPase GspE/PulE/Tfp pilus assembly ATPase PilB-like protein
MDVVEKSRPQDGRIKTRNPGGAEIEMRISTLPTAFGEKMVMRIFDPDTTVKDLDALGFSSHDAQRWEALVKRPSGIILVTGPTGSGKTTTLYSTLKRVATEEVNVSTVEDPIEMIEPSFNQTQVQPQLDFGFPEGLRALMRQDPDIIMVGEIRDLQTAEMAVQAALTGHLVFSTLHTNSAPESITRLMDMGMDPFNFADALLGILAQRLAKRLCDCKEAYVPDAEELRLFAKEYAEELRHSKPWKADYAGELQKLVDGWGETYGRDGQLHFYRAVGCDKCNKTGYKGRVGLHELLVAEDPIKKLIQERARVAELFAEAVESGMRTLKMDGMEKVMMGLTDIKMVRQVCIK